MHRVSTNVTHADLRKLLASRVPFALPPGGAFFVSAETETMADGEGRREIHDGITVEVFYPPVTVPCTTTHFDRTRKDLN